MNTIVKPIKKTSAEEHPLISGEDSVPVRVLISGEAKKAQPLRPRGWGIFQPQVHQVTPLVVLVPGSLSPVL